MLILAPTDKISRDGASISKCITNRLTALANGDIQSLYNEAMSVASWSSEGDRPPRADNRASQLAADVDNYRTSIARACNESPPAKIGDNNFPSVEARYSAPCVDESKPFMPPTPELQRHIPGDVIHTIRRARKGTGNGVNCDSIDCFIDLVSLNIAEVNNDIRRLCNLVYLNQIPPEVACFFTDTYLFCLYKDPDDPTNLRPIGIPSALRRLIASHIDHYYRHRFARHLLPYNFAIGIQGGMDFIIKTMQLSIEKFIANPQQQEPPELPTRAAVFLDLKNMFNQVPRQRLFHIIGAHYPELLPLAKLLYSKPGTVHLRWADGTWRTISMEEGLNQGCPLSGIFAALVLDAILRPLDKMLRQRAQVRLLGGDSGDDGHGSITHFFGYVDDVSSMIPLVDIKFCMDMAAFLFNEFNFPVNCYKTRVLTSISGQSILEDLEAVNPSLAADLAYVLDNYSCKKNPTPGGPDLREELTTGFRLLGSPVGSAEFAEKFFLERVAEVNDIVSKLHSNVPDLQTRMRLFTQCVITKTPHLLGADIMHNLPLNFEGVHWQEWNGPLTQQIDTLIHDFLATLLGQESIPQYSMNIGHVGTGRGGLGLLYSSHRAAPDFVLTMAKSMRYAAQGFSFNVDTAPVTVHPTISDLYLRASNPESAILERFEILLPHIAEIAVAPTCPQDERINHFLTKTSTHSARSRIKQHCSTVMVDILYDDVRENYPEHLHHLPSLLSPEMSYPLVAMCRSVPRHRLRNWNFLLSMLRKLRLPILDPNNLPRCKCGAVYDCFGDHSFSCKSNSKLMAHNIIRDDLATYLQPAIATAGYIHPSSKLETEKPRLAESDPGARPLDVSFDIDPINTPDAPATCPYPTVGMDVTITPPTPAPRASTLATSVDVIETVAANAERHLQSREKGKLMRKKKPHTVTSEEVPGEHVIGDLLRKDILLFPFAIDPLGGRGPMMNNFLFGYGPREQLTFPAWRPNAAEMYRRATSYPGPLGVLTTASINWKQNKSRKFYGHSYTAPTPKEFTLQQIGLSITKAFALHLRNSTRKMNSTHVGVAQPPPPGLDQFDLDEISVDTTA